MRRARADDLQWQWQIACGAASDNKQHRRTIGQSIKRMAIERADRPDQPAVDLYSGTPEDAQILMMGSSIAQWGDSWVRKHGEQVAWLAERGWSVDRTRKHFIDWTEKQRNFRGFSKAADDQIERRRKNPQPGGTGP